MIKRVSLLMLSILMMMTVAVQSYSKEYKMKVKIITAKGDVNINLLPDKSPVTVANFVNLAKKGYYDGLKFHTIFGEVVSDADLAVVKKLSNGDVMTKVVVEGDVDAFLKTQKTRVDSWNKTLKQNFPNKF